MGWQWVKNLASVSQDVVNAEANDKPQFKGGAPNIGLQLGAHYDNQHEHVDSELGFYHLLSANGGPIDLDKCDGVLVRLAMRNIKISQNGINDVDIGMSPADSAQAHFRLTAFATPFDTFQSFGHPRRYELGHDQFQPERKVGSVIPFDTQIIGTKNSMWFCASVYATNSQLRTARDELESKHLVVRGSPLLGILQYSIEMTVDIFGAMPWRFTAEVQHEVWKWQSP